MYEQIFVKAVEVVPWAATGSWVAYLIYRAITWGADFETNKLLHSRQEQNVKLTEQIKLTEYRLNEALLKNQQLVDEKKALENQLKNYQTPSSFALPKPVQPTFGHQL